MSHHGTRSPLAALAPLLLLALALAQAPLARAARDCGALPGCSACLYALDSKSRAVLVCTACATGYALDEGKRACACAAGYYSRSLNGTNLGACLAAANGTVAAAGAINSTANAQRACPANSAPDAGAARCLCDPGYFALVAGQLPRCVACGAFSYTDAPSARLACKPCGFGQRANAARTGCVALLGNNSTDTAADNSTATAANATATTNATSTTNTTTNATATVAASSLKSRLQSLEARLNATAANLTARVDTAAANLTARVNATLRAAVAAPEAVLQRALNATGLGGSNGNNGSANNANATTLIVLHNAFNATRLEALLPRFNLSDSRGLARLFNASRQVARLEALYRDVQAAGVRLPTVASAWDAITPNATVPGLAGGAANTLDALVKVARSAWANEAVRAFIIAQLPVILSAVSKVATAAAAAGR